MSILRSSFVAAAVALFASARQILVCGFGGSAATAA